MPKTKALITNATAIAPNTRAVIPTGVRRQVVVSRSWPSFRTISMNRRLLKSARTLATKGAFLQYAAMKQIQIMKSGQTAALPCYRNRKFIPTLPACARRRLLPGAGGYLGRAGRNYRPRKCAVAGICGRLHLYCRNPPMAGNCIAGTGRYRSAYSTSQVRAAGENVSGRILHPALSPCRDCRCDSTLRGDARAR